MTLSLRSSSIGRRTMALRRGETLIEIMASIMVLCIGLVGVLAAIPFGGFRLSQMTEADNSAAVGRNAIRIMRANGWGNPNNWFLDNPTSPSRELWPVNASHSNILFSDGTSGESRINLRYPFVIDPLKSYVVNGHYMPFVDEYTPQSASASITGCYLPLTHVSPLPTGELPKGGAPRAVFTYGILTDWYERLFYQQDDLIAGFYDNEIETEFRPRLEVETKVDCDISSINHMALTANTLPVDVPSFTGRYTWLAFVYPQSRSGSLVATLAQNEFVSADYDVVVFRERIADDEKTFAARVTGSGYQGGCVEIKLSSAAVSHRSEDSWTGDPARVREQLAQSKYIMLVGEDDYPKEGVYPIFARWYKIANYANVDADTIQLNLIGPNTPVKWGGASSPVTAVLYPGAIGVYSGSSTF